MRNHGRAGLGLALAALALAGCGRVLGPPPPDAGDPVPATLPREHARCLALIENLPPENRANAVAITANGYICSPPGVRYEVYARVAPGLYSNGTDLLPYPEQDDRSSFYPADHEPGHLAGCAPTRPPTGPFRRLRARPGDGPFWISPGRRKGLWARVRLPEDSWVVAHELRGTPFIMTGGWGPGGISPVDAGFIFNTGRRNWSAYMLVAGNVVRPPDQRFQPGSDVALRFEVVADGQVALYVGEQADLVVTAEAAGWRADGLGNRFKRTTSIAQVRENLRTGARLENVYWHNVILRSNVHAQPWSAQDTAENCRYPHDDRVTVAADGWDREWVSIRLPEPSPGPAPTVAPPPRPGR